MFALEDGSRPYSSFSCIISGTHTSLTSARPRLAASSLPACANLAPSPRILDDNRYSPATLSLLSLPNKAASPRQESLFPAQPRRTNTLTHYASKPFRMRTYATMGGGGAGASSLPQKSSSHTKSPGMIFLHKKRNNSFGIIFFRKNRGWGCPQGLLENLGSASKAAWRQCVRGSGMAQTPAPPAPPAGSAVSAPRRIGRTSPRGPRHR
jgi:hypothetical protein